MGLSDLTLQAIGFRVLTLLVVAAVQGFAVAATAVLLGDKGPKYDGRLTAWPAGHVDVVGGVCLVLLGLGWTKPVAVDAGEMRAGRLGLVVVVLAGFAALLAAAVLLQALVVPALETLPHTAALTAAAFLRVASDLTIRVALLSLLPVPPLMGGLLLQAAGLRVPQTVQWAIVAGLVAAIWTRAADPLLNPAHAYLASVLLGR